MNNPANHDMSDQGPWIVPRPTEIVQMQPPHLRWEITRRHPYYLMFWNAARAVGDNASEATRGLSTAAQLILQQINVSDEPPPPSRGFDELDENDLPSYWSAGAITPVQIRNLVTILVGRLLSNETKRAIVDLLNRSLDIEAGTQQEYDLLYEVTKGDFPEFDKYLPNLMVILNPQAPQRAVSKAVEDLVREFKTERGIPEQRRRDDKLDEYLKVWDLREGWTNGEYDCSRELKLKEVAGQLGISVKTAAGRYRSAFQQIIGHEYSAGLWSKVIGIPKLLGLLGVGLPRLTVRRPSRTRRPREVPETVLSNPNAERNEQRFLQTAGVANSDLDQIDFLMDIETLISAGRSDDEIIEEMELPPSTESSVLIRYLRDRVQEAI